MKEKSEKQKKILYQILYWIILNIGTLMLAVGVYFFKAPRNFATGGVSGLAIILANFVPESLSSVITQAEINLAINALLLIIGFIFLGKECTFKTAYCSLVYSLEMSLMKYLPIQTPVTQNEVFLEFLYAMLITSGASAILFVCKASSGGTDIIALIIKKFAKINIGPALLISDFIIAGSTFFIFGTETGLYSILGLFIKSVMIDSLMDNIRKTKSVTIITSNPELISPFILEGMHRGYTSYKATGGYTQTERTIIITICKRSEALKLKIKIHSVDPTAFVIISNANEILGKGFVSD